jgi:ATP phosphoribosyltransferase
MLIYTSLMVVLRSHQISVYLKAICDIVSSGSTLFKNNLKEVETLLKSEAVLAVSPKLDQSNETFQELLFRLRGRIDELESINMY